MNKIASGSLKECSRERDNDNKNQNIIKFLE